MGPPTYLSDPIDPVLGELGDPTPLDPEKPFKLWYRTTNGQWINVDAFPTQAEARAAAPAHRADPGIETYFRSTFAISYLSPDNEEYRTYLSVFNTGDMNIQARDW